MINYDTFDYTPKNEYATEIVPLIDGQKLFCKPYMETRKLTLTYEDGVNEEFNMPVGNMVISSHIDKMAELWTMPQLMGFFGGQAGKFVEKFGFDPRALDKWQSGG